jgi:hypothetical protein
VTNLKSMDEFTQCATCSRVPLVGEAVTVIQRGRREAIVCDPCLAKPRAAELGEPVRRERMKTAAGAETVQRIIPRPVPATQPLKTPAPAI